MGELSRSDIDYAVYKNRADLRTSIMLWRLQAPGVFTVPTATVSRPPAPVTITRTIRPANKAPTVQQEPTTETLESDNDTDDDTL